MTSPAELESAVEGALQLEGEAFGLEELCDLVAEERVLDQLLNGGPVLGLNNEDEVEELVELNVEMFIDFLMFSCLHLQSSHRLPCKLMRILSLLCGLFVGEGHLSEEAGCSPDLCLL